MAKRRRAVTPKDAAAVEKILKAVGAKKTLIVLHDVMLHVAAEYYYSKPYQSGLLVGVSQRLDKIIDGIK